MNAKKESVGTVAALFDCPILAAPLDSIVLGITEKAALLNTRFERMEADKVGAERAQLKARELTEAQEHALNCFEEVKQQKEYLDSLCKDVTGQQAAYKKAIADRDLVAYKTLRDVQFQAIVDLSTLRELLSQLVVPSTKNTFKDSMKKAGTPMTAADWSRLEQISALFTPSPIVCESFAKWIKKVRSSSGALQAILHQEKKIVLDGATGVELYALLSKVRDSAYWQEHNFVPAEKLAEPVVVAKPLESVKEVQQETVKKSPRVEKTKPKTAPKCPAVVEDNEDEMKELSKEIQTLVVNEQSPANGIQFGYSSDDSTSSNKSNRPIAKQAIPQKSKSTSPAPPSDPEQKPTPEAIKSAEKPRRPRGSRGRRDKRDSEGNKIEKPKPTQTTQPTTTTVVQKESTIPLPPTTAAATPKESVPVAEAAPKITSPAAKIIPTENGMIERRNRPQRDRPARQHNGNAPNHSRRPPALMQDGRPNDHSARFQRPAFPPQPFHGEYRGGYGNGYGAAAPPRFNQGYPMNNGGYQNGGYAVNGGGYSAGRVRRPPPGVCGFTFVSA